jgi:hypothetical protein
MDASGTISSARAGATKSDGDKTSGNRRSRTADMRTREAGMTYRSTAPSLSPAPSRMNRWPPPTLDSALDALSRSGRPRVLMARIDSGAQAEAST